MDYRIPRLTIGQLNQLQSAIMTGALQATYTHLTLALNVNKDSPHLAAQLEQQIEDLRAAAKAVMDAEPISASNVDQTQQHVMTMLATHKVYGMDHPEFRKAYLHLAKHVRFNWEHLESMMTPPADFTAEGTRQRQDQGR